MMIIGVDASRALRARRTGTERYALEIIRHLLALPAATQYQWRLYVDDDIVPGFFGNLDCGSHSEQSISEAVNVECVFLPRQRLWTHGALARELRLRPPDLLFVPAHVIPFMPSAFWRKRWNKRARTPSVVTVHDLGYHYFPAANGRLQRLYLPLSTHWSSWIAQAVIAVSGATAQDLQRFYGTAADKITVIHEAATSLANAQGATSVVSCHPIESVDGVRAQYHLPSQYGLFIGTLQPRKNLVRLLEAYAQLRRRGVIQWPLVVVGASGHQGSTLQSTAQALQIADNVHFLGYLDDDVVAALFCGAHLFLFPSLFEGFGLPVLEAQSYGVPVMCANNSSLPEIAGDAALLVDPTDVNAIADAMVRLSEDEALRQELIAAGYENIKRFSWEKAARETLAVFEKVLANHKRGA